MAKRWNQNGLDMCEGSLVSRSDKCNNDTNGVRKLGTLALGFNILITLGGLTRWIYLIVFYRRYSSNILHVLHLKVARTRITRFGIGHYFTKFDALHTSYASSIFIIH